MLRKWMSVLMCICLLSVCVSCGSAPEPEPVPEETQQERQPEKTPEPTVQPEKAPKPEKVPEPEKTPEPVPEPEQTDFILSFAGDCCIGSDFDNYGAPGTLVETVGENYAYPFARALEWFADDDFSMVNLECALTESSGAADKMFRFKAPPSYAKILTAGSVECVTLANNHSGDFGYEGYMDTRGALETEHIAYVTDGDTHLYETESGMRVGIYAGWCDYGNMEEALARLCADGADVIVAAFHCGTEGSYKINYEQDAVYYRAIDCGADIVFGCHPHVLQRVERYGDGVIFFSLGNFVFGGNRHPADQDTAIIRQHFTKSPDGTFVLGETELVPFNVSGHADYNDYQPTPYTAGTAAYDRVLSKLDGTFDGPDVIPTYPEEETPPEGEEENTEETPPEEEKMPESEDSGISYVRKIIP